jgi:predicted nucleotidyltransferase
MMGNAETKRGMTEQHIGDRGPPPSLLADVVQRIVDAVRPLKIILFGSAAREDMGPDSDLNILIVMPEGRAIHGAGQETAGLGR